MFAKSRFVLPKISLGLFLVVVMLLSSLGPGIFAVKEAFAVRADPPPVQEPKIEICHKEGDGWKYMETPAGSSLDGHLGHGDFLYEGGGDLTKNQKDVWCAENATPKLTVKKVVVGGTAVPSDFSMIVNSVGANPAGQFPGSTEGTVVTLVAGNPYGVAESVVAGYTPSFGENCAGTMSAGEEKTCIVTNTYNEDHPQEEPENSCVLPTMMDGEKIDEYGLSQDGPENSLQNILNNNSYSSIDTVADETGYQAWLVPDGTASVTLTAEFIDSIAGYTNTLGYYVNGDINTFVPVVYGDPTVINTIGVTKIGFALKSVDYENNYFYFATEIAENPGNNDHAVVFNPSDNTYVIAFEDVNPLSESDNDYNDLVVEVVINSCDEIECTITEGSIVSGTNTKVTDIDGTTHNYTAFEVTHTNITNTYWTADDGGDFGTGKWVWSEDPVSGWTVDKVVTFEEQFTIIGDPQSAHVFVAADNDYEVFVNGTSLGTNATTNQGHVAPPGSFVINPSLLVNGVNTLKVVVTNKGQDGEPVNNPGGLIYNLTWTAEDCDDNPPPPNDEEYTVTFHKFIDGEPANETSAKGVDFEIEWGNGQQNGDTFLLEDPDYTESLTVDEGSSLFWNEQTDPHGDVLPIGSECSAGKFVLLGYTYGSSLEDAENMDISNEHSLNGIAGDKHIIVWNKYCPEPTIEISAVKIECTDESLLPNWGAGSANITSTTASDWLNDANYPERAQSCKFVPWDFQWAPGSQVNSNPGSQLGELGAPWTTFSSGSVVIPMVELGGKIWIREVVKEGYLAFSDWLSNNQNVPNEEDKYSAEIYCNTDVLNYDNYDRIDGLQSGNTYYCVAWNVPPQEPVVLGDVTMCKVDEEEKPLSGWQLMLIGNKIGDTLFVDSESSTGTDSSNLNSGQSYLAHAMGTWSNQNGANLVDAEYSTTDGWLTFMDGYTGYPTGILELQIDENPLFGDWGAYNDSHSYWQGFSPSVSGPVNFRVFDGDANTNAQNLAWFNDNSGLLSVDIYEGYTGITEENGCFTIKDVPSGTYEVGEVMQDGWEVVEGTGEVVVDGDEVFTVVNRLQDDGGGSNGPFTLTLVIFGDGNGRVLGEDDESEEDLLCEKDGESEVECEKDFSENTIVDLSATPFEGSNFNSSWSESCSGTGSCQIVMDSDKLVKAHFAKDGTLIIDSVTSTGGGGGGGSSSRRQNPPLVLGASDQNPDGEVLGATIGLPNTGRAEEPINSTNSLIALFAISALGLVALNSRNLKLVK